MGGRLAVVEDLGNDSGMTILCFKKIDLACAIEHLGFATDCLLMDLRLRIFLLSSL